MIEHLRLLTPDTARNARTIARCRDMLDRRRASAGAATRYAIERDTLLGFGAVYLWSLAFDVVRVLAW